VKGRLPELLLAGSQVRSKFTLSCLRDEERFNRDGMFAAAGKWRIVRIPDMQKKVRRTAAIIPPLKSFIPVSPRQSHTPSTAVLAPSRHSAAKRPPPRDTMLHDN